MQRDNLAALTTSPPYRVWRGGEVQLAPSPPFFLTSPKFNGEVRRGWRGRAISRAEFTLADRKTTDRETETMTTKTNHLNLSAHWTDRTARGWIEAGATTYRPTEQFRKVPNIAAALPSINRGNCTSELGARERLDTALRTIAFMDAASLRGSRAWRSIFGGDAYGMREGLHPSGFDHTEVWLWSGRHIITTEPYGTADRAAAWCKANGWECAERPAWGMWNPPATTLLLCVPPKRGADLGAILRHLDASTPIPFAERESVGKAHVVERRCAA